MANIKSAIKRIDIAKRNSEHNKPIRTEMKTAVKNFRTALDEERIDDAKEPVSYTHLTLPTSDLV